MKCFTYSLFCMDSVGAFLFLKFSKYVAMVQCCNGCNRHTQKPKAKKQNLE